MKVKNESEVAQLCSTLRDPIDCSPPGSSIFLEHINVMLILYCSLSDVQTHYMQTMYMPEFKNILMLKNANHHLSLQWATVVTSKITDHRSQNNNEKVWNTARITKIWQIQNEQINAIEKMEPRNLLDTRLPQVCIRRKKIAIKWIKVNNNNKIKSE